jgi:hypothetical protein
MKAFLRLLVAAIGTAVFASCTANGNLIYINIQKVTKTNTSTSIPLNITVSDIVNVGSANSASPYYVAAGKIYNGSAPVSGSTNWNAIPVPKAEGQDMLCNALTYDALNNMLWGGFFSPDGSVVGLYGMTPGTNTWTQLVDSLNPTAQFTYVNVPSTTDGRLFVVAATFSGANFVYQLDTTQNGGTSWTATNLNSTFTGSTKPITSVAFVAATQTYYATCANTLYSASASTYPALVFAPVNIGSNSNDLLQSIFVDPNYLNAGLQLIVVTDSNQAVANPGVGCLYFSINGGATWANASTTANTSYNVGFLCFAGPVDPSTHTTYLVGSDSGTGGAFGFFSFVPSNVGSLTRFAGLSYSLYASAVRRILVDPTNNLVAMGTINNGLWVTVGIDTTGGFGSNTWTQE